MRMSVRLASVMLAAVAAVSAPAARAADTLFPDLAREDFPDRPDSVALRWVETQPGAATLHAFHWRPNDVGFPSVLTAATSRDPETGESRFEVVRVDDHCLRFAREQGLSDKEGCLTVTATTLDRGVERVVFSSRYFNYRVQFTLVQSLDGAEEWSLAPSGRRGEPRTLRLRTADRGDGSVGVEWELSNTDDRNTVVLPLAATVPIDGLRRAGLSSFQAGMLAAVDLFYDINDYYVNDWVVRREEQTVDEGVPGPGDEDDPGDCKVVTACTAEYQSCVPTIGGWLACGFGSPGDWGGGGLLVWPEGPGGSTHDPKMDWRTGPGPSVPEPVFEGMDLTGTKRLQFKLVSILHGDKTVSAWNPAPIGNWAKHVVELVLVKVGDDSAAFPGCTEIWATYSPSGTSIPTGNTAEYPETGNRYGTCEEPAGGFYQMRYELDPFDQWDEASESNNRGVARGVWYYRR